MRAKIPQSLQGVLWSVPVAKLDLEKDKVYIINQVLSLGTLPMIKWLFSNYQADTVKKVFLEKPIKDYTASRFHLLKDYLLLLGDYSLSSKRYVRDFLPDSRSSADGYF